MKVLFVSAEAVPFSKTGGLGDVAFSLPKELRKQNLDVRVVIPKSFDLPFELAGREKHLYETHFKLGWRQVYLGISELVHEGVHYYFIDNEQYFKRPNLYGYDDDHERFAYFSQAILEAIRYIDFKPEIIHLNDWHTATIPLLIKRKYQNDEVLRDIKTVFTIHNLKYQGIFHPEVLDDLLGMNLDAYHDGSVAFKDRINFMKAGINYSDKVTTVSKSYATEILDSFYGEQLEWELSQIGDKLSGVTNGIDYQYYDPGSDPNIYKNFNVQTLDLKLENKLKLQEFLGLEVRADLPLIAIVSRLVDMKGLDLMEHVIQEVFDQDIQMVVLGKGDAHFENMFKYYAQRYPERMRVIVEFNNSLAQKIYAASDMFLMPSKIEPCGIGQMVALRYGSIPIVRETGGLRDTVKPYNEFTGEGTGFSFSNYNAHEMLFKIQEAVRFYRDQEAWKKIMYQAMTADNSWGRSAQEYISLYSALL